MTKLQEHSVLLSLLGNCGHTIRVRLSPEKTEKNDAAAVAAAVSAGEEHALLTRFCPICMADRAFKLPLSPGVTLQSPSEPVHRSEPSSERVMALEVVTPVERAYHLLEGSRKEKEPTRAAVMLRNAADIFDRQGRFRERRIVLEEQARHLAEQGLDEEAEQIRQQLR